MIYFKSYVITLKNGFFSIAVIRNSEKGSSTKILAQSVRLPFLIERLLTLDVEQKLNLITEPEKRSLLTLAKNISESIKEIRQMLIDNKIPFTEEDFNQSTNQ